MLSDSRESRSVKLKIYLPPRQPDRQFFKANRRPDGDPDGGKSKGTAMETVLESKISVKRPPTRKAKQIDAILHFELPSLVSRARNG
jgi:hypothetical protein